MTPLGLVSRCGMLSVTLWGKRWFEKSLCGEHFILSLFIRNRGLVRSRKCGHWLPVPIIMMKKAALLLHAYNESQLTWKGGSNRALPAWLACFAVGISFLQKFTHLCPFCKKAWAVHQVGEFWRSTGYLTLSSIQWFCWSIRVNHDVGFGHVPEIHKWNSHALSMGLWDSDLLLSSWMKLD